ncbi:GNAT family protein [Halostella sp. PRR32]|uniref:GNAT family N-acetyltransferase n=2 Tax=Halobacteriales TaxID=2235 RepID=UPI002B1D565E|nr:GNAT family protein [Halostella sp. PRR32]
MPGAAFLRGDRVTLRTVEEEDLEFIRDNIDDPRVRRPLTSANPTNLETTREHFDERISDDDAGVELAVCVDDGPRDGDILGTVSLFDVDNSDGHAEIAYWLSPDVHGDGIMTEAARLLVRYAFEELRLHRVRGRALATNPASQRVLEKTGMQREGVMREAENVNGEYVDMVYFGVLREEWEERDWRVGAQ